MITGFDHGDLPLASTPSTRPRVHTTTSSVHRADRPARPARRDTGLSGTHGDGVWGSGKDRLVDRTTAGISGRVRAGRGSAG
jgi:hypothetical protein